METKNYYIIYLSGFLAGGEEKPLEFFLDDSDSLWYSLSRYGKENQLKTEQVFLVEGKKIIQKEKEATIYTFFPAGQPFSKWLYPIYYLKLLNHLFKKIQKIIIFHFHNINFVTIPIAILMKILGKKIVYFIHNIEDFNIEAGFIRRFLLALYFNYFVDAIMVNTNYQKQKIAKLIKKPIYVFSWGINSDKFKPLKIEKENNKLRLLFVGRLNPVKKVEDIIKALSLTENKEQIDFWIVGGGSKKYIDSLKLLLEKEKINYKFFGFIPNLELPKFYSQADLFVNLRPDEAFGRVFIEAMAYGLPVVGRQSSAGPEELIKNNKNGFLIKDEKELTSLLSRFVKNRQEIEEMKKFCAEFVKENRNYENSYNSLKTVYDKILTEVFYKKSLSLKSRIISPVQRFLKRENFRIEDFYTVYKGKLIYQEHLALYPYCKGRGIDVGCGGQKIHPEAIGIDIVPKGEKGVFGSQRKVISQADIWASGDNLFMFKNNELDYVVASHNLEHYQDPIKTLIEWKRVLKTEGILGLVLPDDRKINTIKLDPTHKHVFTPESFRRLAELIGGFEIIRIEDCIKDWSFLCVLKKNK